MAWLGMAWLGMLLQHIAVTNHSLCTVWATTCSNKLRQVVLVKNYIVYSGELLGKSLSLRWATQIQNDFVWLVKITKLCCEDRDFDKNSPVYMKPFVNATCCRVTWPSAFRPLLNMRWQSRVGGGGVIQTENLLRNKTGSRQTRLNNQGSQYCCKDCKDCLLKFTEIWTQIS